jgi:hypothetical protein
MPTMTTILDSKETTMARPVSISPAQLPADQRPAPVPRKPCKRCGLKNCKCVENKLAEQMEAAGFPPAVREHQFARGIGRRWKFDFSFPMIRLAVEVEGATWTLGRHSRGDGYEDDCEKYNEAQLMGFVVLRFTTAMVKDGRAVAVIERALVARGVRLDGPVPVYTRRYPVKRRGA